MGKKLTFVIILVLTMLVVVTPVLAGGDKNRGDKGVGDVEQVQVSFVEYESHLLVQNQELVQNQSQEQSRVRARVQAHWQNITPLHMWF